MDTVQQFYNTYKDRIFAYIIRMTGDYDLSLDILQESFARYIERYDLENVKPALLFTIARNAVLDHFRKTKKNVEYCDNIIHLSQNEEREHVVRDTLKNVLKAMGRLKNDERDILSMVATSGLSYSRIASIMGISEGNIKVKVHRARIKLKEILSREEKNYGYID